MPRKKIHRFLVADPLPDTNIFTITEERIVHQIGRVLKMHEGEEVALFSNGSGDTIASIVSVSKSNIEFKKTGNTDSIHPSRTLIAAIAIPKGDTFELIVQKLTELGVSTIVPLLTERTVKQSVRLDRLQIISDEAVEQCGGNTRVNITEPMTIKECIAQFPFQNIGFEPGAAKEITVSSSDTVVMYVGPEGGWSEEDMKNLGEIAWVGLGDRILRTETAAIVGAYELLK